MYDSKYTGQQIEELLEQAGNDLVTAGEDESYVVKVVDAEGTVLAGFKESGEIAVPIGLTDDAYTLIKALYEKLNKAIPTLQDDINAKVSAFVKKEDIDNLIRGSSDSTYVAKLVDAESNLLLGFKLNGEMEAPIGVPDDDYTLHEATYKKLKAMAGFIQTLNDRISKLENNN